MKGFFILLVLIVAVFLGFFTQIDVIAQWAYDNKVVVIEGKTEADRLKFDTMRQDSPEQFKQVYAEALEWRLRIAKFTDLLNSSKIFLQVMEETRERYVNSSLAPGNDELAHMIFQYAIYWEEKNQYDRVVHIYRELVTKFPDCRDKVAINNSFRLVKSRLNIVD